MAEEENSGPPPIPDWIVTFTDLMSLLLTFFILLLTFSTPKVELLFELRGSIRDSFGIFSGKRNDNDSYVPPSYILQGRDLKNPFAPSSPPRFQPLQDNDPNVTLSRLRDQSGDGIQVEKIEEGYRIRIEDAIAYSPGEADMNSESFTRLKKVAQSVRYMPFHFVVIGYTGTNELEIVKLANEDPMDLAVRRAVRVAKRLVEHYQLDGQNMAVSGYGPNPGEQSTGRIEFLLVDRRAFGGGF